MYVVTYSDENAEIRTDRTATGTYDDAGTLCTQVLAAGAGYAEVRETASSGKVWTDIYGEGFTSYAAFLLDGEIQCARCIDNLWTGDESLPIARDLGEFEISDTANLSLAHECCVSCGRYFLAYDD